MYVWHVNFCYGMSHCLYSRFVELIVIVQAQHINNRKYSNSYRINDECRHSGVLAEALFTYVPSDSWKWMAAQIATLPLIIFELLILTLIHGC